jgi:hypothetical protein
LKRGKDTPKHKLCGVVQSAQASGFQIIGLRPCILDQVLGLTLRFLETLSQCIPFLLLDRAAFLVLQGLGLNPSAFDDRGSITFSRAKHGFDLLLGSFDL